MDTSIHSLPIEVLLIIFADLAHSSSPHELLQSALVCRLWSEELLPLLYHSVTLSTEAKIKAFIRRKLKKKQHRVISLSLLIVEPTERLVPRLHWLHRKLVWNLFDSLNGQTLKSLVIGQKTAIPLDIFTHPTLSGESIISCSHNRTNADQFFICTHGSCIRQDLNPLIFNAMDIR